MYACVPLSLRNLDDVLFEPGTDICHEAVRHCEVERRFAAGVSGRRLY